MTHLKTMIGQFDYLMHMWCSWALLVMLNSQIVFLCHVVCFLFLRCIYFNSFNMKLFKILNLTGISGIIPGKVLKTKSSFWFAINFMLYQYVHHFPYEQHWVTWVSRAIIAIVDWITLDFPLKRMRTRLFHYQVYHCLWLNLTRFATIFLGKPTPQFLLSPPDPVKVSLGKTLKPQLLSICTVGQCLAVSIISVYCKCVCLNSEWEAWNCKAVYESVHLPNNFQDRIWSNTKIVLLHWKILSKFHIYNFSCRLTFLLTWARDQTLCYRKHSQRVACR